MKIGPALRELRKNKKISQGDLAKKAGISQTSLSQIEAGIKRPSEKTLEKLCLALSISEPLLNLMAIDINDIPQDRRILFEALYPNLKRMILQIAGE
jgi:transcriptional regulator with XRE-family HTH domain